MKHPTVGVISFLAALLFMTGPAASKPDLGRIGITVARMLEQDHFSQQPLDDTISLKLLREYLDTLDYNRLFFLQSDVTEFERRYGTSLDEDVLMGNLEAAFEIYDRYLKRVSARVASTARLVESEDLIDPTHFVEISRKDSPWPKDQADAERLWRDRIAADLLQERLNRERHKTRTEKAQAAKANKNSKNGGENEAHSQTDDPADEESPVDLTKRPEQVVIDRSNRLLRSVKEQGRENQAKIFLSALARVYDPHSEYLSDSDLKSFEITMSLQLVGIGAMLRSDDGYARVMELVPGGPADKDGRLKPKDRIAAVAQGNEPFVDTVDMELDKVVELIRGKKGTVVRLSVIPGTSTDPSRRVVIDIVRDEVKLKDAAASAEIIDHLMPDGSKRRLGWLNLPSFYAEMGGLRTSKTTSATRDVRRLIKRLKAEGIEGLVVDLSRNGGGSLEEAVNLTGLFIRRGPIVQARLGDGATESKSDTDPDIVYDGPLVVLTSRFSASASEIFAAALQDYGRAIIVGDKSTFGKGTVQTIFKLEHTIPFFGGRLRDSGALRFTIQKFYRIAGGSTQFKGVLSDIVLPSATDYNEVGESALKHALRYDELPPMKFEKVADLSGVIEELARRSAERVAREPEFQYIIDDMNRFRERMDTNRISLDLETRLAELRDEELRRETREKERASRKRLEHVIHAITLDNVDAPQLTRVSSPPAKASRASDGPEFDPESFADRKKRPEIDPIKDETLRILHDYVSASKIPPIAGAK